jgi:hypothetical protein
MLRRRSGHLVLLALVLAGLVAGGPTGCASSSRIDDPDGYRRENEKSPFLATIIAIFPGFFVHGLGVRYAGKSPRADELMSEEGLAVGALAVGAGLGGLGYLEHIQGDKAEGTSMVLHRIGEVSSFIGAGAFTAFGLVTFFDSWIRDIAEAGTAAEDHNRELRRHYDLTRTVPADDLANIVTAGAPSAPHPLHK